MSAGNSDDSDFGSTVSKEKKPKKSSNDKPPAPKKPKVAKLKPLPKKKVKKTAEKTQILTDVCCASKIVQISVVSRLKFMLWAGMLGKLQFHSTYCPFCFFKISAIQPNSRRRTVQKFEMSR